MTRRISVVTNISDTLRREVPAANLQQLFLNRGRNPRKHAVRDDVIENACIGGKRTEVGCLEMHSLQAKLRSRISSSIDGSLGKIDANEFALGKNIGKRDQVPAFTAAELEHPAGLHRRRVQPVKSR